VRVAIPGGRVTGTVLVHSELWSARSASPVEAGTLVRVVNIRGLELEVVPVDDGPPDT
jgi:membrane-bound ClpP family serine protease